MVAEKYLETPSADPAYLYQNTLVALNADKRINNGEPCLHAAWIGAVAPKPGETVAHSRRASKCLRDRGGACCRSTREPDAIRECLSDRRRCSFPGNPIFGPDLCECWRSSTSGAVVARSAPWGSDNFSLAAIRENRDCGSRHPHRVGLRNEAANAVVVHTLRRSVASNRRCEATRPQLCMAVLLDPIDSGTSAGSNGNGGLPGHLVFLEPAHK
jgi:hypothetical protein